MPFLLTLCVSAGLGFLSGLGVGGGSLMIVWLTLVCKMDYPAAKYPHCRLCKKQEGNRRDDCPPLQR